jgi:hypothetical protein
MQNNPCGVMIIKYKPQLSKILGTIKTELKYCFWLKFPLTLLDFPPNLNVVPQFTLGV